MSQNPLRPSDELLADLRHFEGRRNQPVLTAYWDPIGNVWTIAYGHTGKEVVKGLTITLDQAEQELYADATRALVIAEQRWPWVAQLDAVRFDAFGELVFNMGAATLAEFHDFLGTLPAAHYDAAANALIDSRWYRQVNGDGRGDYVVAMIRDGVRPALP